jgi:hypothetical protein
VLLVVVVPAVSVGEAPTVLVVIPVLVEVPVGVPPPLPKNWAIEAPSKLVPGENGRLTIE